MNEEEEQEEQGDLMIVGREEVKMIEEGVKMNKEEHEFEDCLLQWTTEGKHYQSSLVGRKRDKMDCVS